MTSITVREATPADVPTLVSLMTEFYAESAFPLPAEPAKRAFEALLASPALGRVWIMECDGEPGGHVVLTFEFSMEYGGLRGFVDDLFVRPAYRRRGLAAAGLAEVRRACVSMGVRALLVEVGPDNHAAQRAYRGIGLTETGHLLLSLPLGTPVHEQAT